MLQRALRTIVLSGFLLGADPALGQPVDPVPGLVMLREGRCATPQPTAEEMARCRAIVQSRQGQTYKPMHGEIAVVMHVLRCGKDGAVPRWRIDAQMDELNRAFRPAGFRFVLERVNAIESCAWFHIAPGSRAERAAKQSLTQHPAHFLNVYVCAPGPLVLGWSYLPQSFPEDDPMHGVVVHHGTLPGGSLRPYDRGRTLVHEVGHYLGLYHTFQNGCEAPGDDIADTPDEASPAFGCPIGRNTCASAGMDPIDNYMDYTDDVCSNRFTPGQIERMCVMATALRPSLERPPPPPLEAAWRAARKAMGRNRPGYETPGADAAARTSEKDMRRADDRAWDRALRHARAMAERATPTLDHGPEPSALEPLAELALEVTRNPFPDETRLRVELPRSGFVVLTVADERGRIVATLVRRRMRAGSHVFRWDARHEPEGVYSAELDLAGDAVTRTLMVRRDGPSN